MSNHQVIVTDGDSVQIVNLSDVGTTNLASLNDVNVVNKVDKSVLVYDQSTNKFVANDVNTVTSITDGGNF